MLNVGQMSAWPFLKLLHKHACSHLGRLVNVWTSSLTICVLSHEAHLNKGVSDTKGCTGKGYTMGFESPPPQHLPHKQINLIVSFGGPLRLSICNSAGVSVRIYKCQNLLDACV